MCGGHPSYPAPTPAPAAAPAVTPVITPVTPVVEGPAAGGPLAPTPRPGGGPAVGTSDTSKVTAKTLLGA